MAQEAGRDCYTCRRLNEYAAAVQAQMAAVDVRTFVYTVETATETIGRVTGLEQ